MPADRLTLYYGGTDPAGNRLDNAQAASIGGNSQYNCDLVRKEGCQFGLAPGRTGKVLIQPSTGAEMCAQRPSAAKPSTMTPVPWGSTTPVTCA